MKGVILIFFLAATVPAAATPYLVAYEGDVFPEQAGWERIITDGGVERTIEDGVLTLHDPTPGPSGRSDQYLFDMNEQLDPGPGEFWFAEWRMRVLADPWGDDVNVFISADGGELAFDGRNGLTYFYSAKEALITYLDGTVFHTFRLESFDMESYSLLIDDQWIWDGIFKIGTTLSSSVLWGDGGIGPTSTSQWDYLRFGVVPVPAPGMAPFWIAGLGVALWMNKRRTHSCPAPRRQD